MIAMKWMVVGLSLAFAFVAAAPAEAVLPPYPTASCTAANEWQTTFTYRLNREYEWSCQAGGWTLVGICDADGSNCQAA